VITVPGNIQTEATGPTGAAVTFTASALDVEDGPLRVDCPPASQQSETSFTGTYALGTTSVTCSSTDAAGNAASQTFSITVQVCVCVCLRVCVRVCVSVCRLHVWPR
jgi:phage protein U